MELLESIHTDQVLDLQKEAFLLNFSNLALFFKKCVNTFLKTKILSTQLFITYDPFPRKAHGAKEIHMRSQSLLFILLFKKKLLI